MVGEILQYEKSIKYLDFFYCNTTEGPCTPNLRVP